MGRDVAAADYKRQLRIRWLPIARKQTSRTTRAPTSSRNFALRCTPACRVASVTRAPRDLRGQAAFVIIRRRRWRPRRSSAECCGPALLVMHVKHKSHLPHDYLTLIWSNHPQPLYGQITPNPTLTRIQHFYTTPIWSNHPTGTTLTAILTWILHFYLNPHSQIILTPILTCYSILPIYG